MGGLADAAHGAREGEAQGTADRADGPAEPARTAASAASLGPLGLVGPGGGLRGRPRGCHSVILPRDGRG
ncbi:hypothetical protein SSTG_01987 [Streptomyces sp. e14]|nr:hypothetical protein SSTG_01987 [Streptomyces sp. e14]